MTADESAGVAGDLANEAFEAAIVLGALFDGGDQFPGHVEGAGAALGLEGQVPAGLSTAWPFEGREAAFDEGAQLSDMTQGGLAPESVPVRNDRGGIHGMEVGRGKRGEVSRLSPGGFLESLADELANLLF